MDVEGGGETDGKLDFGEFCALFNELSERKELQSLFSLFSSKYEWMTVQDLQRFLKIEQGEGGVNEGEVNGRKGLICQLLIGTIVSSTWVPPTYQMQASEPHPLLFL